MDIKKLSGAAGTHYVVSQLLFRQYNCSIFAVDEGIDIVATKGNLRSYIQVKCSIKPKTISDKRSNYNIYNYEFTFKKNFLEDEFIIENSRDIFIIFVFQRQDGRENIINTVILRRYLFLDQIEKQKAQNKF